MTGPVIAFESECGARNGDRRSETRRVHLLGRWNEQQVDAHGGGHRRILLFGARIRRKVPGIVELRGIDEHARHHRPTLATGALKERDMSDVQGAHRGHEPDQSV